MRALRLCARRHDFGRARRKRCRGDGVPRRRHRAAELASPRHRGAGPRDRHLAYRRSRSNRVDGKRRPAHRRPRPAERRSAASGGRARLPGAEPSHPEGRIGTAAQPRHDRRQPAAEDALRLFPRRGDAALQQARARLRLLGAERDQRPPCDLRLDGSVRRHAAFRSGGRARRARRRVRHRAPRRRPANPCRRIPYAPGRAAAGPQRAAPGRADRRDRAGGARDPLGLSQDPRAGILRIRDGLGRRRARDGGRDDPTGKRSRSAPSPTGPGGSSRRGTAGRHRRSTTARALREAIAASFVEARPLAHNGYKIPLAQNAALRVIETAGRMPA